MKPLSVREKMLMGAREGEGSRVIPREGVCETQMVCVRACA